MFIIIYKKIFKKKLKIIKKNKRRVFSKVFDILSRLQDGPPFEKEYNVHQLQGEYGDYLSINLSGDWRIIFSINNDASTITIYDIGTHSQLY